MWKQDQSVMPSGGADRVASETIMNLGKSVVIKGELSGSEDLTLSGQMEGSIKLPAHTLTIGSDADIKAEISATTVVIIGAVTGNVTAGNKVEIQATGSVVGDISSPKLVIADGGRLHGAVEMPSAKRGRLST
jgi:cytoskeletal protein CcmA (bactofilin family)